MSCTVLVLFIFSQAKAEGESPQQQNLERIIRIGLAPVCLGNKDPLSYIPCIYLGELKCVLDNIVINSWPWILPGDKFKLRFLKTFAAFFQSIEFQEVYFSRTYM